MSTISENEAASTEGESTESTLQQLKAKKNKSNLFLIKSYSFIDKTNTINNNNNNNINNNNNNNSSKNNNNNISRTCAKLTTAELLSPDLDPFVDISSLVLSQPDADKKQSRLKKPKKQKPPKTKAKSKAKTTKQQQQQHEVDEELEISEQEALLLRRNAPHEYEELLQHLPNANGGSLPRPQSLPAKVHFEAASSVLIAPRAPTPAKRLGGGNNNNIKRESFLRQSLQSIRRSFGSNKHSTKLAMIAASTASSPTASPLPSPSPKSRVFSNGSTTSSASTTSSTTSSCSSSAAISLLTKAQAHNHILDEFLPTPVVLLLNDHSQDVGDPGRLSNRSTSSVVHTVANGGNSVTDERASTSMAPLQLPSKGAAAANANAIATAKNSSGSNPTTTTTTATRSELSEEQRLQLIQQQQLELQQRRLQYIQQLSLPETFDPDDSSLPQSYANSGAPLQPSGSAHSLGSSPNPSPRSNQSKAGNGGGGGGLTAGVKGLSTAKHDQQTSAAAAAAISSTSAAAGTSSHHHSVVVASTSSASATTGATAATATPPEKEKKRKEVSSSRVKKFHRHFSQVSKDEKLINYFSCALVGDIPLQGHLYITEQHFAFYSNVFGYVTKVVIPTSSVTKISKEKTAKIIPNAVGVATADERHVFGSFISREAAFRLMCTVCTQLATGNEILPKPLPVDVELPEEYLLDDDSSCSISGNESPPHLRSAAAAAAAAATEQQEMQLRQRNISDRHSDLPGKSTLGVANELDQVTIRSSAPPVVHYEEQTQQTFVAAAAAVPQLSTSALPSNTITATTPVRVLTANATGTATASTVASTTSSLRSRLSRKLPTLTELHVLYLGIMLAIMLALFSVFLLYRILDIEAKTHLYNTPVDFNLRSGNDEDIFAEALRWQKELQDKSTAEAQHILSKNLEQISKVRRSLETLSMLIHDRRAGYVQPETATQMQMQMQMDVEATDGGSSTISSTSSAIPID